MSSAAERMEEAANAYSDSVKAADQAGARGAILDILRLCREAPGVALPPDMGWTVRVWRERLEDEARATGCTLADLR